MNEKRTVDILGLFLLFSFLILFCRLFQLQIIKGSENRFLAENNRVRKILIPAERGLILDRHGELLVKNEPKYLLKESGEEKIISREQALKDQTENKEVSISLNRKYLDSGVFSHLIGYLGEVSAEELGKGKLELKGYSAGSLIGKSGVELQYEKELKGNDGTETVEVNTSSRIVRRINRILPQNGKTLTLAVDKKLQEIAFEQMGGRKGAVIATNPQNGEILLLYSSPSFDQNIFLDKERQKELSGLILDEKNIPLLNRAISGLYPPGSTFKIVTSIAGLEEGKITERTLINDPGVIEVNGFKFANWYWTQYGRTEGEVNLIKAMTRSVDTYYYKLGEYLGAENLIKWVRNFGLDEKFNIDLPSESEGFVATPEWKEKSRGESWFLGNTYHMAIGQGDLDLTPLGVNLMTGVVANGGKICTPRVLRIGAEGTLYKEECKDLGIKKEYLEAVKRGMVGACSSGGTGYPFFDFKPLVACKTGTAETGDNKMAHAWFTVIAPIDDPQIVLTVLVERGGEGSSIAAPIAKEILKEYFKE